MFGWTKIFVLYGAISLIVGIIIMHIFNFLLRPMPENLKYLNIGRVPNIHTSRFIPPKIFLAIHPLSKNPPLPPEDFCKGQKAHFALVKVAPDPSFLKISKIKYGLNDTIRVKKKEDILIIGPIYTL